MPNTGKTFPQYHADRLAGVVAGFRVAGSVGKENAVWRQRKSFRRGGLGGDDRHLAAPIHEHSQDVAFDAEVVGNDMSGLLAVRRAVATPQRPPAAIPRADLGSANDLRQIHACQAGKRPGLGQRRTRVDVAGRDAPRAMAPFSRISRVRRRVSRSAMADPAIPASRRYSGSGTSARQLEWAVGQSRITRPAAQTCADSVSSTLTPVLPMWG